MTGILNLLLGNRTPAATDPYFNYNTLLLPGNGTNGGQNNTFQDSSTNNFTITRNGNTTQGTFSPFSQTGWSNYFDGTANGSLRADSSSDTDLSGDFTVQAWVFPTANAQTSNSEIISRGASSTLNGWHFGLFGSTTQPFFGLNYGGTGASVYTQSSTNIPLNQWTHLAVTRSGNTCRIYINGVVDTTNTSFTGTPTVSGTEYVYVGRGSYDTSNRQFLGYINNASIIKGTALTTFSQTAPLATDTSGQSLLTCTANRFIDTNTATTAKTLTVGSGASVQAFSPFAPTAAYSASTVGGSGYFDGSGDYLTTAQSANLAIGTNDFCIEYWVYSLNTNEITPFGQWATGNSDWILQYRTGPDQFRFYYNSSNDLSGNYTIVPNQWTHVAVCRSGSTMSLYVNGTRLATKTDTTSINNGRGLTIGLNPDGPIQQTNGYITDTRIVVGSSVYTPSSSTLTVPTAPLTAISNTKFLCGFTNAGIFDNAQMNNLETVGNAQISTSVSKFGGGSMSFDGTGDFVQTFASSPNLQFGTGDFTVEGWVYFNTSGQHGILQISTNPGGFNTSNTNSIAIQRSATGQWEIYAKNSNPQASATINQSQWYHFAVVRSGTTTTFYVDGVATITVTSDSTNYTGSYIGLGAIYSTAVPLNGYIDDFRITKGIARYTSNFTPQTSQWQDQ